MNDGVALRLLLAEDEPDLAASVGEYLEARGHEIDFAIDGRMALNLVEANSYDVLILDLTLPRLDGLEVCRQLKVQAEPPLVLMLTARSSLEERLEGFEAGADDYLPKPFALAELDARLQALGRRGRVSGQVELTFANLRVCAASRRVRWGETLVRVTPTGFRILECLTLKAPALVSRLELAEELWGSGASESASLRSHLYQLRRSLDLVGAAGLVETLHGEGYRLRHLEGE